MTIPLRVGLVGAGVIGSRRAEVVHDDPSATLIAAADVQRERAREVARRWGSQNCLVVENWQDVALHPDVDVVVVSTINKFLAPVTIGALRAGKHVLCEKPLGRNLAEAQEMVAVAESSGRILKTGFNHRHHPAILRAHEIVSRGDLGAPMFLRCVYGHGGRPGYGKEWRGNADLAGGGEMLDQGIHVVDLCRWFLGEFTHVNGYLATYFWELGHLPGDLERKAEDGRMRLEDNAFALLRTASGRIASIHTSWTQWKNRFSFEVFARDGYVQIEGLGGSYGTETLRLGRRRPESGPPVEEVQVFEGPDMSWTAEWAEFRGAIEQGREPLGNGRDGLAAVRLVHAVYDSARTGVDVPV